MNSTSKTRGPFAPFAFDWRDDPAAKKDPNWAPNWTRGKGKRETNPLPLPAAGSQQTKEELEMSNFNERIDYIHEQCGQKIGFSFGTFTAHAFGSEVVMRAELEVSRSYINKALEEMDRLASMVTNPLVFDDGTEAEVHLEDGLKCASSQGEYTLRRTVVLSVPPAPDQAGQTFNHLTDAEVSTLNEAMEGVRNAEKGFPEGHYTAAMLSLEDAKHSLLKAVDQIVEAAVS